jgi:hypothetical protein
LPAPAQEPVAKKASKSKTGTIHCSLSGRAGWILFFISGCSSVQFGVTPSIFSYEYHSNSTTIVQHKQDLRQRAAGSMMRE